MAKPIVPMPTRKHIETVFYDGKGRQFTVVDYVEDEQQLPDGSILERKQAPNVLLQDGTLWSPAMLRGEKPVRVCQCAICYEPGLGRGSAGLITQKQAKVCSDCGRVVCPQHRRRKHGKWRCPHCHRRYQVTRPISSFFRWVFFEMEGE